MNLSLFLTIYISSIVFLVVFHIIFLALWYVGLVSRVAGRRPEILTVLQNCAVSSQINCSFYLKLKIYCLSSLQVLSMACCIFYSHCGNRAILRQKPPRRQYSSLFSFWKREHRHSTWIAQLIRMNKLKDQVCSSWFAPVGSANDYPLLSKWFIYGEVSLFKL